MPNNRIRNRDFIQSHKKWRYGFTTRFSKRRNLANTEKEKIDTVKHFDSIIDNAAISKRNSGSHFTGMLVLVHRNIHW